jgi:hypothetical protein
MASPVVKPPSRHWTAAELRQLPAQERDAILAAAAEAAAAEYERDSGLTDFEAFGDKDLHADSSDAKPR